MSIFFTMRKAHRNLSSNVKFLVTTCVWQVRILSKNERNETTYIYTINVLCHPDP